MPAPSDLTDPQMREAMQRAEALLDDGDYTGASRALADTYLALLAERPDLVPGATAAPGTPTAMSRAFTWPPTGGITLSVEGGEPGMQYAKERFGMSEAYSYFEFMMNLLWELQR